MLRDVLQKPEMRKLFGKAELLIIQKQLLGISLTQSEKNRLSRDIRPKFAAVKSLSSFKDQFVLKKNQEVNRLIQRTLTLIKEHDLFNRVQAILLFGSHASGTQHIGSDVDIGVVFSDISRRESFQFRIRILGMVSDDVDVQVLNVLPRRILKTIRKNHKILYKKSSYSISQLDEIGYEEQN